MQLTLEKTEHGLFRATSEGNGICRVHVVGKTRAEALRRAGAMLDDMAGGLSPEALVKAALERAAIQVEQGTLGLKGWLDTVRDVQMFMAKNIRALASDPETVADIIEAAKGEPQ